MTNLAPLLLSYIADEINVPRFTSEPRYLLNESLEGVAFESTWPAQVRSLGVLASSFRSDLEPTPLDAFVEREIPGVPRFDGEDVSAFLEGVPIRPDLRASTVWWEFHPLEDGTFVLFPNDADSPPSVVLAAPSAGTNDSFVLRRWRVGFFFTPGEERFERRANQPIPESCRINGKRREPGAPYVGSCENVGCGAGCTASVKVQTKTGIHILAGCECKVT